MPPQSINRNRVTATPKKKSLGLGHLLGSGVSGGEFTPGTDGYQPSADDLYEAAAFMDETPVSVAPTPGRFSPVTVNSPTMDMLFGRGQAASQAGQMNAQQQMALASMEAQRQAAIMGNSAAMEREMYSQGETNKRQGIAGQQALEQQKQMGIINNLAKRNVSPLADPAQFDANASSIANNEDAAKLAAQAQPWYQGEVAGSMRANLQKQGVENNANSRVTVAPDARVFSTAMTPENMGRLFEYPGSSSYSKQSPVMMSIDGKSFPTGQMMKEEGINKTSGGYADEAAMALQKKRDEMTKFADAQGGGQAVSKVTANTQPQSSPSFVSANPMTDDVLDIILQKLVKKLTPNISVPNSQPNYMNMGGR